MKKFLAVVLTIMLVVGVMPMSIFTTTASAATTGDCTWSVSGTVLTISGTGRMRDYDHLTEHPWSNDITEVVIGEGVTHIGDRAFKNCKLERVVIPENVTSIGAEAFSNCGVKTVYYNAKNCNSEYDDFYYIYYYDQYKIYGAYGPGWKQIDTIVFGDNVQSIGEYMFHGCSQIADLTIPDSVTSIGDHAFDKCSSLASVTIGKSVTSIGRCVFQDCTSLASITISDSVTSIGDFAFNCCSSLVSVTIGNSVTSIGGSAFQACTSLTSVTIGNSVTSIDDNAFGGCSSLTDVYYGGEAQQRIVIDERNKYLMSAEWHCNICNFDLKTEHKYKNNCDKTCENCKYIRDIIQHTYDGECDSKCNYCGYLRVVDHKFNNSADLICNKCSFERKKPASISVCVSGPCEYDDANDVAPNIIVYYKNQVLKENVDFLVTYSNNDKIGKAQISVEGIGDYEGIKHEVTFEIVPKDISSAEVTVASCSYTGKPLKPNITVTLDGVKLSSSNYNVYYYDNTLVGTAYVVIVGKGNYCGMIKKNFTIGKYAVVPSSTSYRLCDGSVSSYSIINSSTGQTVKSYSFEAPGGSYADFTGVSSGTYYVKYYTRSSTIRSTMSGAYYVWTGSAYGPYTTSLISFTSANSSAPSYTLPKSLIAEKPIEIDYKTLLFTVSSKNSYDCLDDITWTSSNENLATISEGVLTLKKAGDFKVTATIGDISTSWDISIDELELSNKSKILSYNPTNKKTEVLYSGEILKEGTDYTIATQNKGNATIVTVTGKNLFSGSLTEIFYSDTGYKYCSDKITVSPLPKKLEYKANKENLDLSGAKLSVNLGNNQSMTVELTEDMVSGYDNTVAGEQEIIVTYCGQTTTFKVEVYAYTAGDLTGDDKINSLDGLMLLRHLNGWTLSIASPEAMDVNADGKVNSLDGLMLLRYLNGWNITLG